MTDDGVIAMFVSLNAVGLPDSCVDKSLNPEILLIQDVKIQKRAAIHYEQEERLNEKFTQVIGGTAPEVVEAAHEGMSSITEIFDMVLPIQFRIQHQP